MDSIITVLSQRVEAALSTMLEAGDMPSQLIVPSQNPTFGDYQSNVAMGLARVLRAKPREIAQRIVDALQVNDIAEPPEIAGPGFINLKLKDSFLAETVQQMSTDDRLGLPLVRKPKRILVDFSGPNLAKEMHVGHLRSTIIGDSIARFLEFEGHTVLRINHVGDWGTQFGMLIQYIRDNYPESLANPESFQVDDLEDFYRLAKKQFDEDTAFADNARKAVVELQGGHQATLTIWKAFCEESMRHCHEIYRRLDICIQQMGESSYNDLLPGVVADLKAAGLAVESEGAMCVFLQGHENRDGEPLPMIVQKSDGGYIYATTDLGAVRYRFDQQKVDEVYYITDARQAQHFAMVFEAAVKMGWAPAGSLHHIGFGMMLGDDGKPFKTRTGGTVKLRELLDEAKSRAGAAARELSSELTDEELEVISEAVGWGGTKYIDLVHGIATDYKFSWDKMLALDGNTAVASLITYARTRSVGRKMDMDVNEKLGTPLLFATPQERQLAMTLASTLDVWAATIRDLSPNILLGHLYETARAFGAFWNTCPIAKCEEPVLRDSRIALCAVTGRVLKWGLGRVGIKAQERI